MFDVDCPRTPDEDNKDGAPTSAVKKNNNSSKPPIVRRNPSAVRVSSRPANDAEEGIEVSLPTTSATQYTPRANKSKQLFSPRQRSGKGTSSSTRSRGGSRYKSSNKVGLEPEEFIISNKATALPPRHSQQTAMAPRTPNASHTPGNSRGHKIIQPNSSDGASVNMSQLNLTQQQDTLDNNRSAHHMLNNRPRAHSTEAFGPTTSNDSEEEEDIVGAGIGGSNPFDGDTIDGGGRYIGPPLKKKKPTTLNSRSSSRGYWTEEIIDEEDDKGMFCLFLFVYFFVTS